MAKLLLGPLPPHDCPNTAPPIPPCQGSHPAQFCRIEDASGVFLFCLRSPQTIQTPLLLDYQAVTVCRTRLMPFPKFFPSPFLTFGACFPTLIFFVYFSFSLPPKLSTNPDRPFFLFSAELIPPSLIVPPPSSLPCFLPLARPPIAGCPPISLPPAR